MLGKSHSNTGLGILLLALLRTSSETLNNQFYHFLTLGNLTGPLTGLKFSDILNLRLIFGSYLFILVT